MHLRIQRQISQEICCIQKTTNGPISGHTPHLLSFGPIIRRWNLGSVMKSLMVFGHSSLKRWRVNSWGFDSAAAAEKRKTWHEATQSSYQSYASLSPRPLPVDKRGRTMCCPATSPQTPNFPMTNQFPPPVMLFEFATRTRVSPPKVSQTAQARANEMTWFQKKPRSNLHIFTVPP